MTVPAHCPKTGHRDSDSDIGSGSASFGSDSASRDFDPDFGFASFDFGSGIGFDSFLERRQRPFRVSCLGSFGWR